MNKEVLKYLLYSAQSTGYVESTLNINNLASYLEEITEDKFNLRETIEHNVKDIPEFRTKNWPSLHCFGTYRVLLYALIRELRPKLIIETGVLHGLSSAFYLQALENNSTGQLISIDLPSIDKPAGKDMSSDILPAGYQSGWIVPDHLSKRWELILGKSEEILPEIFKSQNKLDIFIHDSDHTWENMMVEYSLAWKYLLPGGLLISDNINWLNRTRPFEVFTDTVNRTPVKIRNGIPPRWNEWRLGIIQK
jgi:predicted O-methyltransferase YrrM